MFIEQSTATLTDLTVEGNEAPTGPDIYNAGSFACGTSCGVGQYGDCSETALTSDASYQCYVNCGSCRSCPAGTSNPNTGSSSDLSCQECPVGQVSPMAGTTSCTSCEAGHYATDNTGDYIVLSRATNCSAVSSGISTTHKFCYLLTTQYEPHHHLPPQHRSAQLASTRKPPARSTASRATQERAPTE